MDNVGKVIKWIAVAFLVIGFIVSIIVIPALFPNADTVVMLICMFGGPLASCILAILIYGFGQLVENSDRITEKICGPELEVENTKKCPKCNHKIRPTTQQKCPFCNSKINITEKEKETETKE